MLDPLFTKFPISRSWHRLYIAFLISSFGDQFTRVALFAKVYELGGEVSGLTAVVLAQSIPSLIVSPLVGALSDRGRKRDYLLISDLARCILLALIAWCYTLSGLIVLAALVSTFSAMFRPVEASFEADLLTVEDITKANVIR